MTNFLLIAFCISAGVLFKRRKIVAQDAHKPINAWIINIALPAVSFKYLPHLQWSSELLAPALSPLVVFFGGLLFIQGASLFLKPDGRTKAVMQLCSGLSNTSFIGFPLIMAYFSEKEISIAVICDQVTFVLFSVFGIILAMRSSGSESPGAMQLLKKLISFPPFIGCLAALFIPKLFNISALEPFIHAIASTVAPLALFSIGLQISLKGWSGELRSLLLVLGYKLCIAPALVLCLLLMLGIQGMSSKIAVFEAAMPILLSMSILSDTFDLNPKLANLLIGVSIPASFLTTWIWWGLIERFL